MITTKDITVGNYFYYHYSENIPRDVCQIWDKQPEMSAKATISHFERGYEINNGFRCIGSVPLEMLSPIPLRDFGGLTTDFGFDYIGDDYDTVMWKTYDNTSETGIRVLLQLSKKSKQDPQKVPLCIISEVFANGNTQEIVSTLRIKYLHELQNILRSLNIDGRYISFQRNSYSVQTYIQE